MQARATLLICCSLWTSAAAVGLIEPHSCSQLNIVHTNMPAAAAEAIQLIYSEVTEKSGTEPEPISKRLTKERGGFWDAYFMGDAFSYSVYCSEYVELASDAWNVLLCRESEDDQAYHCGAAGLALYHNGTLTPRELRASVPNLADQRVAAKADHYDNWLIDSELGLDERMPLVVKAIEAYTYGELQQPGAAEALRRVLEERLPWAGTPEGKPSKWNVLIERSAGGHYYYSEEQFNVLVDSVSIAVAVFDRRCHTLQLVDGYGSELSQRGASTFAE